MSVLWELKKRGYAEKTIQGYCKRLKMLAKHVSLDKPEQVKAFIAGQTRWSNAYKESCVTAYSHYVKQHDLTWEKPFYVKLHEPELKRCRLYDLGNCFATMLYNEDPEDLTFGKQWS